MHEAASENRTEAQGLLARAAPGGRTLICVLASLVPISGGTLVALDAQATGSVDWTLAGAAGAFTVLGGFVVIRAFARLRGIAAVADAVRAATQIGVTASELRVGDALGPHARAWNQLIAAGGMSRQPEPSATRQADTGEDIIDSLPDGIIVVNQDARVVRFNAAASAVLGGDAGLARHSAVESLVGGELVEPTRAVLAGGPVQRVTINCGSEEAPQVLRVRVARVGGSKDLAVVTLTDITRQSVAEASRGGFLARATHELRAPLTNIKLYAEQAIEEGDDPQLRQESLNVIGREVLRLERTVGDLLRVSELESGSLRSVQSEIRIDDMLEEIREAFTAAAAAKSIALTLDVPPKLPVLRGDRDHIELLIQNLVGNAIKYTPEGGSVALRADGDDGEFTLEVVDTGIGIAPEESTLVFEKFYRAGDDRVHETQGSGLGLSLAREIARRHGGDVTLESELNRGSTFTLRMPVSRAA